MGNSYHLPVMLQECIDGLSIKPEGVYIDLTFGGGGHSAKILAGLNEKGKLLAFDQDEDVLRGKIEDPRFELVLQNFRFLKNYLRFYGITQVDGILADLGVSSHQFDQAQRGFSIRYDALLDMRMDRQQSLSAADVVNTYSEEKLADVLYKYGEIRNSYAVASSIVRARSEKTVTTTFELMKAVKSFAHQGRENKFYAMLFQALRIEVNKELEALEHALKQSLELLKPGGRLVVMSYHSLEDRLVKNFMRSGNFEGEIEKDFYGCAQCPFRLVQRKPIIATEQELSVNPRARSAKLRIAEKI